MKIILTITYIFFYSLNPVFAQSDDHDHKKNEPHANEDKHSDHDEADDHDNHSDHDEESGDGHDDHDEDSESSAHDEDEEEGSSVVGPDKGILEKGREGFKLAPEAMKTFELKIENIKSKITEIARPALVEIKNDKFIYRVRDGWIKKVFVKVLRKSSSKVTVDISQFKDGDQIITNGVGFVRTAELVAEEGVSHGHSH